MGHSRQRVGTGTFHPKCVGESSTTIGGKHWCHSSDQGAPAPKWPRKDEEEAADIDEVPKECLHRKHTEGKALKEPWREVFSKESDIMKVTRWAYQKAHWANFEQERSYDLPSIFHQMAISTNLLSTKVYDVQETWECQKDLRAANQVERASPKDIHFVCIILPTELPKITGLKGIHSSKAL